ncbi:MAG: DUF86 domain-containing protein [Gammaproteobacteria bacterium]|nr:DUF86 domain-containing protein [Gammaproteobacteria bacterium]
MSDAESGFREWRFYVEDMLKFCDKVLMYTAGLDKHTFLSEQRTYDATLRNLELIGEAATHVPNEVRNAHSDVPWHAIIGTRNRLAHGYLHISDDVIWSIIQDAIPNLVLSLRNLLDAADEDPA